MEIDKNLTVLSEKAIEDTIKQINIETINSFSDEDLDYFASESHKHGVPLDVTVATKCGLTVESCRLVFGIEKVKEYHYAPIHIEDALKALANEGYIELDINCKNFGHVFSIIKCDIGYLFIHSFVNVYYPIVSALMDDQLIDLLTAIYHMSCGNRIACKDWFLCAPVDDIIGMVVKMKVPCRRNDLFFIINFYIKNK